VNESPALILRPIHYLKRKRTFQSHPQNHKKNTEAYGYVLSLVLRRMPTAASVAVAVIDN